MTNPTLTDSINEAVRRFATETANIVAAAVRSHVWDATALSDPASPAQANVSPGQQLLRLIKQSPNSRAEDLLKNFDRKERARVLRDLCAEGYLRTTGRARGTRYTLTAKGEKYLAARGS